MNYRYELIIGGGRLSLLFFSLIQLYFPAKLAFASPLFYLTTPTFN